MNKKEFTDTLSGLISIVGDNEKAFLDKFLLCSGDSPEIQSLYMAGRRTRIEVLFWTGETVTKTIITSDFIDWCGKMSQL